MLTIFIRAFLLYLVMLITVRGMGKHQLGQFQPYEFAMAMLIADLVSTPMADVSTPLLHGILPIAALFVVHGVITVVCAKSDRLRALISGKPAGVISNGRINHAELDRLCLSLSDLLEGLRKAGMLDPAETGTAVVEANGNISAFPSAANRPATASEQNISLPYDGLPLVLIMDGRVQYNNLGTAGLSDKWLEELLSHYNLGFREVFFASVNTQGCLHLQTMDGALLDMRALEESEVKW